MTDAEKDAALTQLGSFQKSLKEGLGKDVLPLQLNKIKQFLGNRMNWGGTISVTDDIKPALRSVYGMMNKLISDAVPEAKELNERLSNLYAAQSDLETLTKAEEVGRGGGATGGKIGSTMLGKAEREVGRVLPGAAELAKSPAVKAATKFISCSVRFGLNYSSLSCDDTSQFQQTRQHRRWKSVCIL